jgi:ABC-type histidine transport system ATPase subunit
MRKRRTGEALACIAFKQPISQAETETPFAADKPRLLVKLRDLKLVEDLALRGMTMITVTHEMGFARRVADLVVFMHQGKVWEIGSTAELFANPHTAEFRQFIGSEL